MLLRLNWKWRSPVLDVVWVRRRGQSHPELLTVKTDKTGKNQRKVIKQIHTSKHYGTPGFNGGRDRNVIRERRQSKRRSERRADRTESGIIRGKSRGD